MSAISDKLRSSAELGYSGNGTRSTKFDNARTEAVDDYIKYIESNVPKKADFSGLDYVQLPVVGNLIGSASSGISGIIGGAAEYAGLNNVADYFQKEAQDREKRMNYWNGEKIAPELSSDYLLGGSFTRAAGNVLGSGLLLAGLGRLMPAAIPFAIGATTIGQVASKAPFFSRLAQGVYEALPSVGLEAMAEGGNAMQELRQQGVPLEEREQIGQQIASDNAKLLLGTQGLEKILLNRFGNIGKALYNGEKAGLKTATAIPEIGANWLMQGIEEGEQEGFSNKALGKEYSYNPLDWYNNPELQGQKEAFETGIAGTTPFALFGLGGNYMANRMPDEKSTDPWENAFNTFKGQRMKNGDRGCVEAVTKIGAEAGNTWIGSQLEQSVVDGDTLASNAQRDGLAVIAFDPANVERGDIILYNDTSKEGKDGLNVHSVIADGNGGIWGNSFSQHQVTSQNSYDMGDNLVPATIIKASAFNDGVVADGEEFEDEFDGEENTASGSDTFLAKIGMQESGGNYDAVNPDSGAKGKYQIMPYNWQPWAEEAGLDGNAEMTPENQEIVARHKLIQYYDKYGEKGALVAWYAGEGNAERYVKGETTDVWGREWTAPQDGAPSIQSYVDEALAQNVPNGGRKRKTRKTQNTNINSTGNGLQSDNATLDDYLKLFDDGNKNSMTYADYERLINSASDDEVLSNANKAVMDYTQEGNLDSFTQLTEMIGDDDVDGLRELAKEHARAITIDEQSPNDNEIDNTADVQNEPINTFDFTEAINGLMEIANNGIQEQQVVARQALQSNAPLFVLNTYKQLTSGAPLEQADMDKMNAVLNSPAYQDRVKNQLAGMYNSGNFDGVRTVLGQIPDKPSQAEINQQSMGDNRGAIEETQRELQERTNRRQVNDTAQQIARQQAESLNNNAPLTAQEQATANSVLNSTDGVFTPQIKNELFNALRNGDNAGVRRVINGVPDNIPSQADVHQQSMAEIQESIGNARKNVNRAMAEKNLAGFMETLDEVEKEFMEFLDNLFYETGKGFIDVANGLISDVRRSRSEEEREVLINAIEGLATIAGKAKEYEARRNELRREGGVGEAEGNRPVRQTEIPSEAGEIAKAYGLQLKERLKQNNVPISEQAIDRSLNSENQNEVEHVVGRLESIAERNNVPVEDIKENKPKTINQQLAEARAEKEELLGGYLKYIDETSGQGVDIIPLNDGSSRGVRSTKNAKWYSEWYQQNKQKHGKMSKKDKLDIAEQMYRGQIETEETAVVNRLSKEEFDKYQAEQKEAIEKLDAINAKIAQLEKAKEETKNNNDKEKIPPKKGASSNAKKKKEPKTTLTQQESREGVESETQGETPSNKNKPVLNRKSEGQNSKAEMVKESGETATVSKAEIVGENIRDDFMSKDMKDTVSTFLPVIRQKLNQFFLSAKPHKDKKHDSIYGGRTIEEVKSKMERLTKSIVNLVDTLSDFTADEKQVMKEVLQSRSKKAIDKAVKKIKDSNTKLAVDTSIEGIQEQAKINREKQLELVKTEFPTATNIVQNEDSIRFNLNDEKIRVDYVDRVIATDERKQAYRRDYGKEYTDDVSILGDTQTINGEQVITLLNRIGYEDTLSHEAFHLAFRTALTKAQQKILLDKYGNEEAVAEAYRELMNKSNARGTMFDMTSGIGRLFQKIWNFANSLFNVFNNGCMLHDAESIMYAIADGSIYELNEKNEKGITAFLHPALLAAWHGTNRFFDEFDLSYNGTGEGSNIHGWGLYFALNKTTSEKYAEFLKKIPNDFSFSFEDAFGHTAIFEWNSKKEKLIAKTKFKDGTFSKGSELNKDDYEFEPYYDFVKALADNDGDMEKVIADLEQFAEDDPPYKGYVQELLDNLKENKITLDGYENPQSVLYKVDVPSTDTMLREDKPFSQQPKQVQEALKKLSSMFSYKELQALNGFYDGGYNMIADKVAQTKQNINEITDFIENGSEREQSDYVDDYNEIKGSSFENLQDILAREEKLLQGYEKDLAQKQKTIELDKEAEKLLNKWKKMDGKAIYSDLERVLESPKQASLTLLKSGIQGISYNGNRDDECCVIFNDKAVKILERNGEPVNNADEHGVKLRAITNADSQLEAVRKQYEGTDQWMKAPNGKPTNLTERQWLQVRTPNFKEWFGDWENDPKNASKIVDENGEPLVVYHGTPLGGFEVFNRELNYFTADKEYADRYQDPGASSDYVKGVHEELGKAMTYPVFLNIRKPFDTRKAKERKIFEKEFYRQWGNGAPLSEKGLPDWTDSDDFREFFEENDYDYDGLLLDEGGVPTEDGNVKSRGISYVAFKPNQIKSATDNSGEFNTENDNIKYSRAVSNPNSAESLKKNGDTDTRLDKLPKVDYTKLNKTEKDIMKFGKALGVPVHFVTHYDPNYRGVFTHNGEIFINRKATVPAKDIFIHEFVHWLKASGNENIYDSLSACLENIKGVSHAKQLSEYRKSIFNGERMTNDEIIEEIICDAMSHTVTANRLINDIGKINSSIAEKIVGHMKGLWDKFCNAVGYHQGKPISQQSLPNHLSANELAKMDAILNRQLANIKGKDGKPVFAFKNGKWTVARNGKTVGESYNTNPISATIDKQSQKKVSAERQLEAVRKQYKGTDQWMKAPNGKPTNLTEKQWLQVRTPNFKDWFGDWENDPKNASKVVDENGEPLVVYHGTDTKFDVFSLEEIRDREGSFFFAEQVEDAESYAVDVPVMNVFVNVRKPFDYENGKVPSDVKTRWNNAKNKREQVEILRELGYDGWLANFENGTGWGEVSAFNSNQIKSATDNSGDFSTVDDNIKYSRSKPTEETASSDTEGMFKRANKELLKKMGFKVDADKNVDVVRKSTNPQDINWLNRVFNSPSFLARYNKLLAPFVSMAKSAVEKQEKLRYDFRNSLNEVEKILGYKTFKNDSNYKENKDNLNKIMILGDTEGKEYNAAELQKMGYNEQVIKAYLKMRKTLNDAWEMLNNITRRMKFGTSNLTEGELADLKKNNPFLEITSVSSEEDDNGRKRYTYKYPSVTTITEHLSKEDIDNLKKNDDVKIISFTQINNSEYIVKYAQRRRMGKIKGYVPHIFHEWSVVEVDKNGKILQDDNGNSKFIRTFSSMNEAIKYANGLDKKGNYRVMPKLHEVMGASERSMIVQDFNYLKIMDKVVEDFTLTPEEAVELMNSGIKTGNRGRFLGNLMKRKGVKGYEEDMMYATYQYLNQVGRYVALDPFKRLAYSYYEKMFGAWEDNRVYDGELGQSAKWARMYIDSVNGVPTSVEKNINNALHALGLGRDVAGGRPAIWLAHAMTYPMTISLLGGGNVSSALLNITQLCNLFGAMGDMSIKSWEKLFKNSYKNYWIAWRKPESEMGKLLWEDLGLRYMLGMDVAGGYSRTETDGRNYAKASALAKYSGGLADLQARVGKIAGVSMFMFRGTDSFGRGVTLLTAYQKAIDEGKTKTEAIRYAKMVCDRVNFDYSQADANGLYQRFGVLANVLLQFQKYPMKQLELFYDIFKEQKGNYRSKGDSVVMSNAKAFGKLIQYMTPYMALTGISGVPFIGLASALLGFVSGDDDKDLVEEIRAGLRKEFGEDSAVVNAFNYGLLGAVGVDVGKRIGIGDYLSGGTMKQTPAEMFASKTWVAASTAMQSARQLRYGNYAEALKAINPSLGNIWIAANGEVRTTRGRLKYQYQSNWERFVRGMGFTPVGETLAGEQAREDYKNRQDEQAEKQAAIDEFIAHPTPANAKTLNDLGITPKSLKTERERKNKTSHEINQEKEEKKKEKEKKIQKKKVYSVNDYQKEK